MQQYAGIYILKKSIYMFWVSIVAKFGHVGGRLLLRYYDLYQRLQLQLQVGAMDTRNM